MTYQYRGQVTIDREAEHQEELRMVRRAERTALAMVRAIQLEVARLDVENQKLREALATARKDKKRLQSRVRGLKKVRPVTRRAVPAEEPIELGYGGPRGLLAAVEEAARVERRKKLALAA